VFGGHEFRIDAARALPAAGIEVEDPPLTGAAVTARGQYPSGAQQSGRRG